MGVEGGGSLGRRELREAGVEGGRSLGRWKLMDVGVERDGS